MGRLEAMSDAQHESNDAHPESSGARLESKIKLLFVCLGNICRSPTAEAVMRKLIDEHGLAGMIEVDSAGTGSWHVGESPDERAAEAARLRGIALCGTARKARSADFLEFDLILAMDEANVAALRSLAPSAEAAKKIRLLREFDAQARAACDLEVPDPYQGGSKGFEHVLDILQPACEGLLAQLCRDEGADRHPPACAR